MLLLYVNVCTYLHLFTNQALSKSVTISFSYAYHNRTDPTFSLRTLDVTMTSL